MEETRIQKQICKTGNTAFVFEQLQIDLDGDVFLPMHQLNELRRQALEALEAEICRQFRRKGNVQPLSKPEMRSNEQTYPETQCSGRDAGAAGDCAGNMKG